MRFEHFFSIFAVLATVCSAAGSVCSSGVYGLLGPLAGEPKAAAFCSAKFPTVVTVTKGEVHEFHLFGRWTTSTTTTTTKTSTRNTATSTKVPTTAKSKPTTPSTTTPSKTTPTTKASSTTSMKASSTTTSSSTLKTSTTSVDKKAELLSSLSSIAYNVASTFCSCYFPPKTVSATTTTTTTTTVRFFMSQSYTSTTSTTTTTTTTTTSTQATCTGFASFSETCKDGSQCPLTIGSCSISPEAACEDSINAAFDAGTAVAGTYDGSNGECILYIECCPSGSKRSLLARSPTPFDGEVIHDGAKTFFIKPGCDIQPL
ncbi:hypothetical protein H2200_006033 [Cladophialophora chaetospira]|uniref:Uncharacterized protein n=1 Tax=Cladophialophora chaetospira TaxID=386627 RepID=A0AA39CIX0_9EURO|nr:hypothetical protein H2200_006033 [Cladophialophora chaetospira]